MSILIKGVGMPKKGECIDIVIFEDGTVVYYDDDQKIGEAVELPDHGDLIDRDALMESLADWQYTEAPQEGSNWRIDKMVTSHEAQYEKYLLLKQVYDEVKDFPVMVIPAERSKE